MRVVIDTNVLVSELRHGRSLPFQLIALWRQGKVTLITSAEQLEEIRRVTRYPKLRARLNPAVAGRLVNELKGSAIVKIGRASCRERVCQYVLISVVPVLLKNKRLRKERIHS